MSQPIFFITNILEFQFPGISIFVVIDNVAVTNRAYVRTRYSCSNNFEF